MISLSHMRYLQEQLPIIIQKYWHKPAQVERYTPLGHKLHDCGNYFYDVNQCVSYAHLYNVLVKMYFMNE